MAQSCRWDGKLLGHAMLYSVRVCAREVYCELLAFVSFQFTGI